MLKKIGVIFIMILCLVELLNLGGGVFFEIPDNIPIIGNLDEGAAGAILIWCLQFLFKKSDQPTPPFPVPPKKLK